MKIRFLIREEDLLEALVLLISQSQNRQKQRWTVSIFVTVIVILIFYRHSGPFELQKIVPALVIGFFCGGLLFFRTPHIHRKHYLKQINIYYSGIMGNSVELQITDDFIETWDETGEAKLKLTAIKKVYETDNLFVILFWGGSFLAIAKQHIDSDAFRDCLTSHGLNIFNSIT